MHWCWYLVLASRDVLHEQIREARFGERLYGLESLVAFAAQRRWDLVLLGEVHAYCDVLEECLFVLVVVFGHVDLAALAVRACCPITTTVATETTAFAVAEWPSFAVTAVAAAKTTAATFKYFSKILELCFLCIRLF